MTISTTSTRSYFNKKNYHPSPLMRWGAVLLWLLVWQVGAMLFAQPLLLPTPVATAVRLVQLGGTADFWQVTAGSLGRIAVGFLLGLVGGAVLAVLTAVSHLARAVVAVPMSIIKATPVASFAILALLFIRSGWFTVFISLLMVLPMAWGSLDAAIAGVDREQLAVADLFGMRRRDKLWYIYLPELLPPLLATARTGLGFAWKAGIAGEVIAVPAGAIGTRLYNAKVYLETVDLFAWTVVVILLSLLLEHIMVSAARRLSDKV